MYEFGLGMSLGFYRSILSWRKVCKKVSHEFHEVVWIVGLIEDTTKSVYVSVSLCLRFVKFITNLLKSVVKFMV